MVKGTYMKKILFVTANGIEDSSYGGPKGSIRNYKCLQKFGNVDVYWIKRKSSIKSFFSILQGFFPPIDKEDIKALKQALEKPYDLVFFDGSIYGKLIDVVKSCKTVVFYHNCEFDFNEVRFGAKPSLKKFVYKYLIKKEEQHITKTANYRITFSERDADRISGLYGKKVESIIPLGIEDKYQETELIEAEKTCLLLGAICEANIEGYGWFVNNVSPKLNCTTIIAGKGFEKYRELWESDKVIVKGYVDNLSDEYARATCVAIPLFSGGGMKVKTVEALMFGKTIFGTSEAFSGFDFDLKDVAYLCNDEIEFVDSINTYLSNKQETSFNLKARQVYKDKYSIDSAEDEFFRMICNLGLEEKQ